MFIIFLCQSLNIAKDTTSIDLYKIENNNLLRIFIYYKFVIINIFSKYKSLLRFVGKNGYVNRITSIYNNLPILTFRGKLKTSTQNIFELSEKFDLITSIGSLEFFDPKKILKQIYELLNENGICYINVSYFWYLINKDKVKNKFFGEIREIHKNSKTYTVEDYSNLANEIGFEIVCIRRNIQGSEVTNNANMSGIVSNSKKDNIAEILNKAKQINNNVLYEDLRTYTLSLILKKI